MPTKSKVTPPEHKQRSPKGTVNDKPVAVRFLPAERQQIQEIAAREHRCLSNMTRLLVLQGLKGYGTSS